jgi:hypothetical protein
VSRRIRLIRAETGGLRMLEMRARESLAVPFCYEIGVVKAMAKSEDVWRRWVMANLAR